MIRLYQIGKVVDRRREGPIMLTSKDYLLVSTLIFSTVLSSVGLMSSSMVYAASAQLEQIAALRDAWASAKYESKESEQDQKFKLLIDKSKKLIEQQPNNAAALAWYGTILSTYASIKGGMGALHYLHDAKEALEKSIAIDPKAEEGLAHTILGALYARVPGWPVSFKDKKQAEFHLHQALTLAPNSMDANYFFGDYLMRSGQHKKAKGYLNKALNAPPRMNQSVADAGRRSEVMDALASLERP